MPNYPPIFRPLTEEEMREKEFSEEMIVYANELTQQRDLLLAQAIRELGKNVNLYADHNKYKSDNIVKGYQITSLQQQLAQEKTASAEVKNQLAWFKKRYGSQVNPTSKNKLNFFQRWIAKLARI